MSGKRKYTKKTLGQSIARFGQWDVCESLHCKVLCLRRYDYQLEKEQERNYKFYF
jgi:hypothetical protein